MTRTLDGALDVRLRPGQMLEAAYVDHSGAAMPDQITHSPDGACVSVRAVAAWQMGDPAGPDGKRVEPGGVCDVKLDRRDSAAWHRAISARIFNPALSNNCLIMFAKPHQPGLDLDMRFTFLYVTSPQSGAAGIADPRWANEIRAARAAAQMRLGRARASVACPGRSPVVAQNATGLEGHTCRTEHAAAGKRGRG